MAPVSFRVLIRILAILLPDPERGRETVDIDFEKWCLADSITEK